MKKKKLNQEKFLSIKEINLYIQKIFWILAKKLTKQVYMFLQGLEEERILEGFRAYPSRKVIIVRNSNISDYNRKVETVIDKLVARIKEKLRYVVSDFEEVYINFFNFIEAFKGLERVIFREKVEGREVYVNITGGTRLVASAALLACFLHGAKPIYVSASEYTRMEVIAQKAGEVFEIPSIPLDIPSVSSKSDEKKALILKTLYYEMKGYSPSLEKLAEKMGEAATKRNLAWISYHVRQLEQKGLVQTRFLGRKLAVKLTSAGAFSAIAAFPDSQPYRTKEKPELKVHI